MPQKPVKGIFLFLILFQGRLETCFPGKTTKSWKVHIPEKLCLVCTPDVQLHQTDTTGSTLYMLLKFSRKHGVHNNNIIGLDDFFEASGTTHFITQGNRKT